MITINFYPESDKEEFVKAAQEYAEIWREDGEWIFQTIERLSGLKFKTKLINALTFEGTSYSVPLRLRSSYSRTHKEATLIHELCHRLLVDNDFYFFDTTNRGEDVHKAIDLVLYDIWVEILGEESANDSKDEETSYNNPDYKNAWEWSLSFDKETRQVKFKELVAKYSNNPKALRF